MLCVMAAGLGFGKLLEAFRKKNFRQGAIGALLIAAASVSGMGRWRWESWGIFAGALCFCLLWSRLRIPMVKKIPGETFKRAVWIAFLLLVTGIAVYQLNMYIYESGVQRIYTI